MGEIILLAIGVVIGWVVPKPSFVQTIQDKIKGFIKK